MGTSEQKVIEETEKVNLTGIGKEGINILKRVDKI